MQQASLLGRAAMGASHFRNVCSPVSTITSMDSKKLEEKTVETVWKT
jgi:hypothetical protein